MKAKRLFPAEMRNQYFSFERRREALAAGQPYDVQPFLILPAGEVVDDPDCWKLCIGDDAVMVPVDDECRAAVLAAMSAPKRLAFLRNIQLQNKPEIRKQATRGHLEWIDEMMAAYGKEVEALDPKPVEQQQKKAAKPDQN